MSVALRDLARRPPELVRGPKALWAVLCLVNFIGPVLYFVLGRRRAPMGRSPDDEAQGDRAGREEATAEGPQQSSSDR